MAPSQKQDHLVIILPIDRPEHLLSRLSTKFPSLRVTFHHLKWIGGDAFDTPPYPKDLFQDATILFTLSALPHSPAKDAPLLEWVHLFSAGIDFVATQPIYKDSEVTITTASGIHGPQIAEWVIMTGLVHSHSYNYMYDLQKKHVWGKSVEDIKRVRDMHGKRVGILGYGSIGRQVARMAQAMGCEVLAFTASPKETEEERRDPHYVVPGTGDPDGSIPVEWFGGLDQESLHKFLRQGLDWVVVCVPLTRETTHLLSTAEFDVLSERKSFIFNVSRGAIIDHDALVEALRAKKLGGCALDVTDPEPLPEDSPLWDMDDVVITPHISGLSTAYSERVFAILEENLQRRVEGKDLLNVVSRKKGY